MNIFSVSQLNPNAPVGCYGVFSTLEKALEYLTPLLEGCKYNETIYDGCNKTITTDLYEFEIWRHKLDE